MNDQGTTVDPQVDDDFLKAMGFEGTDEDRQQKVLAKILRVLDYNVLRRLAPLLNDQQLDELTAMLEAEDLDETKIQQWFSQNVPNFSQIVEEEAQNLKKQQDEIMSKVMEKNDG